MSLTIFVHSTILYSEIISTFSNQKINLKLLMWYFTSLKGKSRFFLPVQQCHLAEKQQNSVGADTHPAGLSGSLLSSHLKVTTFLVDGAGAAEVPWEFRPLWSPTCPALIEWFSSSSSSSNARNEYDIGGDWIGVALQHNGRLNIHSILKSIQCRSGKLPQMPQN